LKDKEEDRKIEEHSKKMEALEHMKKTKEDERFK
jgi:hypothetical protein